MTDLAKEYVAPTSATSGLQPYGTGRKLSWEQRLRAKLRSNGRQEFVRPKKAPRSLLKAEWNEADHPRAEDGKFGEGTGASKTSGSWKQATPEQLAGLKVPPGWRDVQVSTDPDARVLAKGRDAKGREVRIYSAAHAEAAAAEKFARLKDFHDKVPQLVERARETMLNDAAPRAQRDTAAAVYLISQTGLRPGSEKDTKAEKKAFGATNLRAGHVEVGDKSVTLNFTGKKGVDQSHEVTDPHLVSYLSSRAREGGSPDARLFHTSPEAARAFVKSATGEHFKTKDLRTWVGTSTALRELKGRDAPRTEKDLNRLRREVATKVSQRLGNTPSMALKAYIDPAVWPAVGGGKLGKGDPTDRELMDDFCETTRYDRTGDWRETPATDYDPEEDDLSKLLKAALFKGEWNEEDHPRAADGKFGESSGASAGDLTRRQWDTWFTESPDVVAAQAGSLKEGVGVSGSHLDAAAVAEYKELAERIQAKAETEHAPFRTAVFRGEIYESMKEVEAKYGKTRREVELPVLTSASASIEDALTYANGKMAGGRDAIEDIYGTGAVRVLVSFEQKGGVQGTWARDDGKQTHELVMPKGAKFRVGQFYRIDDKTAAVQLYASTPSKGKEVSAPRDKLTTGSTNYGGVLGLARQLKKFSAVGPLLKAALSVDHAAHDAATSPFNLRPEPTEGQKSSGQYKKGSFKLGGMEVRVENPAGSYRRPEWPQLKSHYGYFAGTRGADGDPVDCFVRVGTPLDYSGPAFVINQTREDGTTFDEHKVMLGWHAWDAARAAYLENFTPGWPVGEAFQTTLNELRAWLRDGNTRAPYVGEPESRFVERNGLRKILQDRLAAGVV